MFLCFSPSLTLSHLQRNSLLSIVIVRGVCISTCIQHSFDFVCPISLQLIFVMINDAKGLHDTNQNLRSKSY